MAHRCPSILVANRVEKTVLPQYGRDFLHHQDQKNTAPDAEDEVVQLEEKAQSKGLLRLHDLPQTEHDCEIGDESSDDGRGGRERSLALDIVCQMVGQCGEGDVGEQEICDGGHA